MFNSRMSFFEVWGFKMMFPSHDVLNAEGKNIIFQKVMGEGNDFCI